jgi:hypothetical protein
MNFIQQFRAARRVSTPLVAVRTADAAASTNLMISKGLNGEGAATPLLAWDVLRGVRGLNDPGKATATKILAGAKAETASTRPSDMLRMAQALDENAVLFAHSMSEFWKDPIVAQGIWNLRDQLKTRGAAVVMLVGMGASAPSSLAQDIFFIDEPLPTREEISQIIDETFAAAKQEEPSLNMDEKTRERAVDALAGLAAFPAEQSFAMAIDPELPNGVDPEQLWQRKIEVIEQTPGLKIHRGKVDEPRGLENAKTFLRGVMEGKDEPRVILFADEVEKGFAGTGSDLSGVKTELAGIWCRWTSDRDTDGMLCIGVPGAGKSMLAKWVGGEYGKLTITLSLGDFQSSLVGQSGEQLRNALAVIDAISGGRAVVIGTCNSIGALPPEIRRRFNLGIFFFDLLSADERDQVWTHYEKQYGVSGDRPDDEGWTGAEVRECVRKAYRLDMTLQEAATYVVPVSRSASEQIEDLRASASGRYISASQPGLFQIRQEVVAVVAVAPKRKFAKFERQDGPVTMDHKGGKA